MASHLQWLTRGYDLEDSGEKSCWIRWDVLLRCGIEGSLVFSIPTDENRHKEHSLSGILRSTKWGPRHFTIVTTFGAGGWWHLTTTVALYYRYRAALSCCILSSIYRYIWKEATTSRELEYQWLLLVPYCRDWWDSNKSCIGSLRIYRTRSRTRSYVSGLFLIDGRIMRDSIRRAVFEDNPPVHKEWHFPSR